MDVLNTPTVGVRGDILGEREGGFLINSPALRARGGGGGGDNVLLPRRRFPKLEDSCNGNCAGGDGDCACGGDAVSFLPRVVELRFVGERGGLRGEVCVTIFSSIGRVVELSAFKGSVRSIGRLWDLCFVWPCISSCM